MRGRGRSRWERKGEGGGARDESMQCSPTGSVYKWAELLPVAMLHTEMSLWGLTACCPTMRHFKPVAIFFLDSRPDRLLFSLVLKNNRAPPPTNPVSCVDYRDQ